MIRKRIFAHIIDCIIASMPMIFCIILLAVHPRIGVSIFFYNVFKISIAISYIFITLKDCIGKRSIGKRIMGLKIVDKNGDTPCFFRMILRNIITPIWFIDAFFIIVLCKTKPGDRIAKTRVCESDKEHQHRGTVLSC